MKGVRLEKVQAGLKSLPTAHEGDGFGTPLTLSVLLCGALTTSATIASLWALCAADNASFYPSLGASASIAQLVFRGTMAAAWVATLSSSYIDSNGLQISHRGRTVTVRHLSRFVTFTLWCNATLAVYWLVAAASSALWLFGGGAPVAIDVLALVLWEIAFPLSWLVAMVVSFVLIPAAARREPLKVAVLLRWRPQVLHNGYVLACAAEAVISSPPFVLAHFPIMICFGCAYIYFAWRMHARMGVYAYFFLDPTFSWSPIAYAALLAATTGCFVGCEALTAHLLASEVPAISSCSIMLAALATCTFRHPAAASTSSAAK
jgi:hypothetical protein